MSSYLERFAPKQRELIISLPYRVGLWISRSDTSGGDEADAAELEALKNLMTGYAEDFLKSEVVEEVMRHTVSSKDKWDSWSEQDDSVLHDCDIVIKMLQGHMRPEDILSFRQSIMDVARTVALAYREDDEENDEPSSGTDNSMGFFLALLKAKIKGEQPPMRNQHMNISSKEHEALLELSQVLKVTLEGDAFEDM